MWMPRVAALTDHFREMDVDGELGNVAAQRCQPVALAVVRANLHGHNHHHQHVETMQALR